MAAINDPKTLLISDGSTVTLFDKVMGPFVFGGTGGILSVGYDWFSLKPVKSGLLRHLAWVAIGMYVGKYVFEKKTAYVMDRDAAYRHYIDLHPEDFPPPKRTLLKDMMKPWSPCR